MKLKNKLSRRAGRVALFSLVPLSAAAALLSSALATPSPQVQAAPALQSAVRTDAVPRRMFTNPIVRSRDTADPWLTYRNGYYYFTFTVGRSIEVWRSSSITGLDAGKKVTVWRAPATGPNSQHVWAPEIHFLNGRWYIYYTATDGPDPNRRQFILEATTSDPQGPYRDLGQLVVPYEDEYAIDGSVFQAKRGALYFMWSGREKSERGPQNLYIAPMISPTKISGRRVKLSTPTYAWEKVGWGVNEGPEMLQRNGKSFIIYSASGGTTPDYCLGMLTNTDGNLLRAESWTKSATPVFKQYEGPDGVVYTPGHNGFCKSPDGKEDWIIYHGKNNKDGTWGGRTARAQRFTWNADDTPNFGHPIPPGIPIPLPSGESVSAIPQEPSKIQRAVPVRSQPGKVPAAAGK